MKTVYISGPMTGYPYLNFPAFNEAEEILVARGFKVINPARIEQPDKSWEACMKKDIAEMMKADMIVTLPNWEKSKGANLEVHIGHSLGMKVRTLFTSLQEDSNDDRFEELQRLQSPHRAPVAVVDGHESLTARQSEALNYIIKYYDQHGYSPSIREVQEALNLQSASTAQGIVKRIEEKGYIKRNGKKGLTITGLRERGSE